MSLRPLLIDAHSHIYTPRLVQLLKQRSQNPRIHGVPGKEKLAILPEEVDGGRTVGPQYWDRRVKLNFMNRHGIDASIISIANPWLDFLPASEAVEVAKMANEDLEEWCKPCAKELETEHQSSHFVSSLPASSRIRAFGILPFSAGVATSDLVASLVDIAKSEYLKGAIIGSRGKGKGLDDPDLEPLWACAEKYNQPLFLHPHYGVGADSIGESGLFGTRENGHVLPLALGFPFETASAAARLILSGVFDRYPSLKIILAHSGGALPALSSRLSSCIIHDPHVASRLEHDARFYMGQFYYDSACYGTEELEFVAKMIGRSERYKKGGKGGVELPSSIQLAAELKKGVSRIVGFSTDHPFFRPIESNDSELSSEEHPLWKSVTENLEAIRTVPSFDDEDRARIQGGNVKELFQFWD